MSAQSVSWVSWYYPRYPLHRNLQSSEYRLAASRSVEELDVVVGNHVQAKKQYDTWTEEDEAGYQIYLQEQDMEKRTYRAWYLIANPRKLPKEIVNQELAFRFKLFPDKMDKKK